MLVSGERLVVSGNALREEFYRRREKMLSDKIDVTAFLTWFIENYPDSATQTRKANAEFWTQFK